MSKFFGLAYLLFAIPFAETYAQKVEAPKPYGALPTQAQLEYAEMELTGFVHFTTNTFTNKEWGYGDEDPSIFNPSDFDVNQIVKAFKAAGIRGLILTCKHHDGFCMWPTKTTDHNISKSPWKGGKGDMVKEFAEACRRKGLKFGVYLSPWDRNSAYYGTPKYIEIYREQFRELLTNYGPIFETWHDGANGGDGYYGGARERRVIDKYSYYDWATTWKMATDLHPNIVIFSDIGPGCRWVGNERGFAKDPCYSTITLRAKDPSQKLCPGIDMYDLETGTRDGNLWIPAEVDFSIRPGWFFHSTENAQVKTAEQLFDHYFWSVGRGANMLLNVPPDRRGRVHELDEASMVGFGKLVKQLFSVNYAKGAGAFASNVRGNSPDYAAEKVLDADRYSYWATDDQVLSADLTLKLRGTKTFNVIRLRENIKLGQRIREWAVDIKQNGQWVEYAKGEAIGANRLIRGDKVSTDAVRIRIMNAAAAPCLGEVGLYAEPMMNPSPKILLKEGFVTLVATKPEQEIRYTTNGAEPTAQSTLYSQPFSLPEGGLVKAACFFQKQKSSVSQQVFSFEKSGWLLGKGADRALIDFENSTVGTFPVSGLVVGLREPSILKGFIYLPRQDGKDTGTVSFYTAFVSNDGLQWEEVASGEFSNIRNNPIEQIIAFRSAVKARYFKLVANKILGGDVPSAAEVGLIKR